MIKSSEVATFWVQVWNLPIHCFSKDIGVKIGSSFNKVKEIIIPPTGSKEGKHMKMLVEMDISQPILRGTSARFNEKSRWIHFRYDRIPDFCYNCGIIGHGDKVCFNRNSKETTDQGQQYGEWLRVKSSKSGLFSGKPSVYHDYFNELKRTQKNLRERCEIGGSLDKVEAKSCEIQMFEIDLLEMENSTQEKMT